MSQDINAVSYCIGLSVADSLAQQELDAINPQVMAEAIADVFQGKELKFSADEAIEEGTGVKPSASDTVKVHYHGTLIDGTVFDSSISRGSPATFGVHQVIKGWTEALQLMPVGSKYRLYIPQDLAYGAHPHPGAAIKPFMALIFDVELIA